MKFFFMNQNKYIEEYALRTAIHFLQFTGFFIETEPAKVKECDYLIFYGNNPSPELRENFKWTFHIIPAESENLKQFQTGEIKNSIPVFGDMHSEIAGRPFGEHLGKIESEPVFYVDAENRVVTIYFDLIKTVYFHLTRKEEEGTLTFHPSRSVLSKVLQIPAVDVLVYVFEEVIIKVSKTFHLPLIRKKRWPMGQPLWYVISHDVDLTRKWGPKSLIYNGLPLLFQGKYYSFKKALKEALNFENSYWTFPELINYYGELDWHATFFFLAEPWEGWSYRYNIRKNKFLRLFSQLLNAGHEIQLHTSKFSFGNAQKVKEEKKLLENCIHRSDSETDGEKQKVNGVRQHFLKCAFPEAFEFFDQTGFRYDSSMAYNESAGFRSGTSLPYKIYPGEKREIWEIPFAVFEYHLNPENFFPELKEIISDIEKVEGMFHFLFHPSNLAESGYRKIFHYLNDHFLGKQWNARWTLSDLLNYVESWRMSSLISDEGIYNYHNTSGELLHLELWQVKQSGVSGGKIFLSDKNSFLVEVDSGKEIRILNES